MENWIFRTGFLFHLKAKQLAALITVIVLSTMNSNIQCQPTYASDQPYVGVTYHNLTVDGVRIFYREAGDPNKPPLLLLHGFPSSSFMFHEIMPLLADEFHLIAPDYPGFGQSEMPSPGTFDYSFENLSRILEGLIMALKLENIYLYVHDYGGPIGFRIASRNPSLIKGIVIQNSNAYEEGWGPASVGLLEFINDPSESNATNIRAFLTLEGTKFQYLAGADTLKVSPDGYSLDQYYLEREGNAEIQFLLFKDYKSNTELYKEWQHYFRSNRPYTLILWGKNDPIFRTEGALAYKKDLPDAKLHLLDGGHFLLAEQPNEIARLIKDFLKQQ